MELINLSAENYAEKFTSAEDALLAEINKETYASHAQPQMLSGHVQGKVLEFISTIMQPQYILEIGTFVGYSGLCLAKGLQPNGELHTIELRPEDANICAKNFAQSELHKKIHLHIGNALHIIPTLPYKWDIVFIDADKQGYTAYYDLVVPRLSERGIIIADNVLFHGQVLAENISGKNALAMDAFNIHIKNDSRVEAAMLTVRDGLMLIRKL